MIFVGEIRDPETASAAHPGGRDRPPRASRRCTPIDAIETVNRIVDFFPPHQQRQMRDVAGGLAARRRLQRLVARADGDGPRAGGRGAGQHRPGLRAHRRPDADRARSLEVIADGEFYGMQTFDQALVQLVEDGIVGARTKRGAAVDEPARLRPRAARASLDRAHGPRLSKAPGLARRSAVISPAARRARRPRSGCRR